MPHDAPEAQPPDASPPTAEGASPRPRTADPRAAPLHRAALVAAALCAVLAVALARRLPGGPGDLATGGLPPAAPLLVTLLAGTLAAIVGVCRPVGGPLRHLVAASLLATLALVAALAAAWALVDHAVRPVGEGALHGTPLLSPAEADAYLAARLPPVAAGTAPPWRVPTGVLLVSVEFVSANNVRVTGYLWQHWPPGVPKSVVRGVELPEAVDGTAEGPPTYDSVLPDGSELTGWHIQVTLRQFFDYRAYPFDRQDVWLRMWSRDFNRDVVLVPDFASYPSLAPDSLPGLDPRFVRGGWWPEHTHFSYSATAYDATLGYPAARQGGSFPELYFNLGLKRAFLEPFLDYVVFSLVVALLLFGVLVLTREDETSRSRFGISTFGVLGSSGTLLFAVILKHAQLRSTVAPEQIVYLEALPILLYVAIVLVALNAIVLVAPRSKPPRALAYRDNLLPTLLYWPLLLAALLAVTLAIFGR